MAKIPVGQTVAQTYGFAFGRYLPLLGVLWLPILIMAVGVYFLVLPTYSYMPQLFHDIVQHAQQSPRTPYFMPPEMNRAFGLSNAYNLLSLLLAAVIAVGVTKEALGLRTGPRFVYYNIDSREFLVIGGWLLLLAFWVAAVIALVIVFVIVAIIAAIALGDHSNSGAFAAAAIPVGAVLFVVIAAALVYFLVRLSYFIVPVTAAEKQFGVFRSWELTKGNFWRIFAIILATLLPLLILESLFAGVLIGPALMDVVTQLKQHPNDSGALMGHLMQTWMGYGIYSFIGLLVLSPIIYGLTYGQSAFAYRALVPAKEEEKKETG